jgi:large subunit ribosomal protein L33
MRENIILACTKCRRRNYTNTKNRKRTTARLELKKFCPFCRSHTLHRETR